MHSVKAEKQGEAARHRPDADGNPEAEGLADSAQAETACNSQGEGDQNFNLSYLKTLMNTIGQNTHANTLRAPSRAIAHKPGKPP